MVFAKEGFDMTYLLIKWLHILCSTIVFGTGVGSAFYMFAANRRKNIEAIAEVVTLVVIADFIFTTPAFIFQLVSGFALAHLSGLSVFEDWLLKALIFIGFAGACWLPVVWMQVKMRDMARQAVAKNMALSERYWRMERWWIILGCLAFPAFLIVFYLMVVRPA
jgi:uncharacterized membrane protein